MTTLIISNEEIDDIMKRNNSLEESGLFMKGLREEIKNERKVQKDGFLTRLLGTLGASLLGNLLTGKGGKAKAHGQKLIRANEGTIRAGQDF